MKKTIIVFLFLLIQSAFSVQIGSSLGTGMILKASNLTSRTILEPKHININLARQINKYSWIHTSFGYGYENNSGNNPNSTNMGDDATESISGFNFGADYRFIANLNNANTMGLFWGIGVGYYYYNFNNDYNNMQEEDIRGLAQYFCFGFKSAINTKTHMYVNFKKMGLSNIESKRNSESYSYNVDYNSYYGLESMEITVGLMYQLGN